MDQFRRNLLPHRPVRYVSAQVKADARPIQVLKARVLFKVGKSADNLDTQRRGFSLQVSMRDS